VRYSSGSLPTKYTYTGQYSNMSDFGLMFYNARWYDPYLNHFTQPDTIVPNPYNSADWNRYSYARYNPLRYNDPSGHRTCTAAQAATGDETCDQNIYGETRTNDVLPTEDVPLTEMGAKISQLFQDMYDYTEGWWWDDGSFTLEEFLGMWIIHEAAGDPEKAALIAITIAQSLYVGHVVGANDAACTSEICHNGVFNIMAAKANAGGALAGGFLDMEDVSAYGGYGGENGARMGAAAQYGSAALHPTSLIRDKNDAPFNWGNSDPGTAGLRAAGIDSGDFGTRVDSIYFMQGNWLIYTPNQAAYWISQGVPITTVNQSP
jgi:RHS repeat-associated protein